MRIMNPIDTIVAIAFAVIVALILAAFHGC